MKVIQKLRDALSRQFPIFMHYGQGVIIGTGTILFGLFLVIYKYSNVIENVQIFPNNISQYFGIIMMLLGTIKLTTVFKPDNRYKKWSLMGITIMWLIITWAYITNPTHNMGFIMAATLSASCYLELWRGDFNNE